MHPLCRPLFLLQGLTGCLGGVPHLTCRRTHPPPTTTQCTALQGIMHPAVVDLPGLQGAESATAPPLNHRPLIAYTHSPAACRVRGVEFVVAPYEADAQLAFLASIPEAEGGLAAGGRRAHATGCLAQHSTLAAARAGDKVQLGRGEPASAPGGGQRCLDLWTTCRCACLPWPLAVVTEDSDLVGYGCRRVLFKMDRWGARRAAGTAHASGPTAQRAQHSACAAASLSTAACTRPGL